MQQIDAVDDPNSFVEDIRTELMRVTQNEDNSQDAFIVHSDLKAIWSRSRVHTLLKLCCLCPENMLDQVADIIIDHYLKTISILVHIPWMQWPRFIGVFLGNATTWKEARIVGRNDDNLPYNLQDLRDFLGNYARGFDFHQWLFLPVRIGERRSASLADYTEDHRLPVLKTEPLGRGASGVVYRETIAPGCLALGSGSWNAESIEVARKHIETQEDFDSESVVIERLKNNRLRHRHITRCYGVVVRQGRLQSKLDIFYELASFNLSQFLTSRGEFQPTSEIQRHVLTQTFSLIDALVLCHEQFYDPEQGHVILAHNDLKPENILVFDNDAESLVGTWKIADFGLSKIKQVVEDSTFLSPDDRISHDLSLSKAIRPPGGYTAPEIVRRGSLLENSSSVQCDIWSLGCILAQILVFTVGGSQALRRFNHLRLPGNTFNYRDDRYFESYPGLGQLRLKRPLFEVLIELCDSSSESNWVKQLVNLVFDVLMVDKDPNGDGKILLGTRPKASTIRDRFRTIQKSHRSQAESITKSPTRPDKPFNRVSISTTDTSLSTRQDIEADIVVPKDRQASTVTSMSISHSVSGSVSSNFDSLPLRIITPPTTVIDDQQRSVNHKPTEIGDCGIESSQGTSPTSSTGPVPSLPCRFLPMKILHKSPSVNISCTAMKAVELASDARFVVLWSDRQVVVYSLSSAVREQLLDYSLTADPQRRINSITTFGSTLAVTVGAPRSDEVRERTLISSVVQTHANYVHQIKFFRINNRTSSQHKRKAHGTLILGETDHFRRVLLGINDTVVLIYSNCLRIGTLRDDLQDR
ncbi:hypothetical protein D6C97_03633 [Aureobasidium pullulans]|nr:hypothetical protein D6C97_03633 [Aureobasidium pullulans]